MRQCYSSSSSNINMGGSSSSDSRSRSGSSSNSCIGGIPNRNIIDATTSTADTKVWGLLQ